MMASNPDAHISHYLLTVKSLPVSQVWLSRFLSSQRSIPVSLPALTQTALFRLLASDFTTSLAPAPSNLLPTSVSDPNTRETKIPGPIPLQVLDIEDIGSSLWTQIEAIERVERGETTRGREIIRTVMRDEGGDSTVGNNPNSGNMSSNSAVLQGNNNTSPKSGQHRLVLEDPRGTKVVAIELSPVESVGIGKMPIGAKLLIKNATVARGMLLLEPSCVTVLGGKIEDADTAWNAGRKDRLLAKVQQLQPEQT
ncbi:hypothetical protein D8B26_004057 [Coccidioides posadasii str. Silveira]|nr:hypothetical protein D8B26_004057 [Coccidioides posadasii str. Silveira]